jgi:hypothetical protein
MREELQILRARYDYHFPPNIYAIIRALEVEVAWAEYRRNNYAEAR